MNQKLKSFNNQTFIAYALIKFFTGKFSSTSPAIWVIAALSFASFYVA